jgi:hypothetical protein
MEGAYELPLMMCSGGMIYVRSIMKICEGIKVIWVFLRNLKGCRFGISNGGFMKCAVAMDSDGMIQIPRTIIIG